MATEQKVRTSSGEIYTLILPDIGEDPTSEQFLIVYDEFGAAASVPASDRAELAAVMWAQAAIRNANSILLDDGLALMQAMRTIAANRIDTIATGAAFEFDTAENILVESGKGLLTGLVVGFAMSGITEVIDSRFARAFNKTAEAAYQQIFDQIALELIVNISYAQQNAATVLAGEVWEARDVVRIFSGFMDAAVLAPKMFEELIEFDAYVRLEVRDMDPVEDLLTTSSVLALQAAIEAGYFSDDSAPIASLLESIADFLDQDLVQLVNDWGSVAAFIADSLSDLLGARSVALDSVSAVIEGFSGVGSLGSVATYGILRDYLEDLGPVLDSALANRYSSSLGNVEIIDSLEDTTVNIAIIGGQNGEGIYGKEDIDLIHGGGGNDVIFGDGLYSFDDFFPSEQRYNWALERPEFVFLGLREPGDDILYGGDGNDHLDGEAGDDRLYGGSGDDKLYGGNSYGPYNLDVERPENYIGWPTGEFLFFGGDDLLDGGAGKDELWGGVGKDTLIGGEGDDELHGEDDRDILRGGGGDDELDGGDDADQLWGGDGVDILSGGLGADTVFGEDGDDWINSLGDGDEIDGGEGSDVLSFAEMTDGVTVDLATGEGSGGSLYRNLERIGGTEFDDVLIGNHADNGFTGQSGNDYLDGADGVDTLYGNDGDDTLFGGWGHDYLNGGPGNDRADGGYGDDSLFGDIGDDELFGGEGDDWLSGVDGNDLLEGGAGRDSLLGAGGNDVLKGGGGDDSIDAGDGNDVLFGGSGNDELVAAKGDNELFGGDGDDILRAGHSSESVFSNRLEGGGGNDTLRITGSGPGLLFGGDQDDELFGGQGDDRLQGDAGDDTIEGGDGDDLLSGGDGDDFLNDLSGQNVLDGGPGDDVLIGAWSGNRLTGGPGQDRFEVNLSIVHRWPVEDRQIVISDFEIGDLIDVGTTFIGSDPFSGARAVRSEVVGSDTHLLIDTGEDFEADAKIVLLNWVGDLQPITFGNSLWDYTNVIGAPIPDPDPVFGTEGSDGGLFYVGPLNGTWGNDTIWGLGGNDTIRGDRGNDRLIGGSGDDKLYGGRGDDILEGDSGGDTLEGGDGDDQLYGAEGADWLYGGDGNDLLDLGDGDLLNSNRAYGGPGNDRIVTRSGFADLYGGSGDDTLEAKGGRVNLYGGSGSDVLVGGDYSDIISGSGIGREDGLISEDGADTLTGGGGNDLFYFDSLLYGFDGDVITDLAWDEKLSFQNVEATDGLAFSFIGQSEFSGNAGEVRYIWSGGETHLLADTDGDGVADSRMRILNGEFRIEIERPDTISSILIARPIVEFSGSAGADISEGSERGDRLSGFAGNDDLRALAGDDTLRGGAGDDTLNGGLGSDTADYSKDNFQRDSNFQPGTAGVLVELFAGRAVDGFGDTDTLVGIENAIGTGFNDVLHGYSAANRLDGGAGNDALSGYGGDDTLIGGDGNDSLAGGTGIDTLEGGFGDDRLYGEDGNDIIFGGAGNDYVIGNAGDDFVSGGDGNDRVQGRKGNDRVYGEAGDDELLGGNGEDYLVGNDGQDRLFGEAGNDNLQGREGDDYLSAGTGDDRLVGGTGTDTADYSSFGGGVEVNLAAGTVDKGAFGIDSLAEVEIIVGSSGTDLFTGTDGADIFHGGDGFDFFNAAGGDDLIHAGAGDDRVFALDGNDVVFGGDGDDYLVGNLGDDILYGEAGDDNLQGREGNDTMYGGEGNDFFFGLSGNDVIYGEAGFDFLAGYDGDDVMSGGDGDDRFFGMLDDDTLYGGEGADFLIGNEGNDTIFGDAGNDNLRGRIGNDALHGGAGNDYMLADEGDDWLTGDGGFDTLFGGSGADTFYFSGSWQRDTVGDWQDGIDRIDLSGLGLKGAGESDADAFARLTLVQSSTTAIISVTGDTRNDIRLENTNIATLSAADFVFDARPAPSPEAISQELLVSVEWYSLQRVNNVFASHPENGDVSEPGETFGRGPTLFDHGSTLRAKMAPFEFTQLTLQESGRINHRADTWLADVVLFAATERSGNRPSDTLDLDTKPIWTDPLNAVLAWEGDMLTFGSEEDGWA